MNNSDEHFLYFSLSIDNRDSEKIIQLEFEGKYDLLKYLEDKFRVVIRNSENYLNAYAFNGFLSSKTPLILAWEKEHYIINENQSVFIDEMIIFLKDNIENIVIGGNEDNFWEMRFKLGTLFSYYDFSRILSYTLYSSYNFFLGKEKLSYDFYIKDYETKYISSENFKITFNCEILIKLKILIFL